MFPLRFFSLGIIGLENSLVIGRPRGRAPIAARHGKCPNCLGYVRQDADNYLHWMHMLWCLDVKILVRITELNSSATYAQNNNGQLRNLPGLDAVRYE